MYELIWRSVPGGVASKIAILAVVLVSVLAALFLWVFPAIAPLVPFNDQTVEDSP